VPFVYSVLLNGLVSYDNTALALGARLTTTGQEVYEEILAQYKDEPSSYSDIAMIRETLKSQF
jgi:hypothetical protein